jgi:4-diphosphocytidyl-2-C-methyl-D-erythritol kinase
LWNTGFGPEALGELAVALGADVPFFLHGGSAWAEGIGDQLRAIDLQPRWYVVLVPPGEVRTADIFTAPELTRNTEALKMEDFSARPRGRAFVNDLEPVVVSRYPEVRRHLEWLREHAGGKHGDARMTGSGGCVFADFESREAALGVLERLPAPMKGFVAQGLARHPMRME